MLRRRRVLSLPLLGASVGLGLGRPWPAFAKPPVDWRREVNELRFGASGLKAATLEPGLRQRLRVKVTGIPDQGGALVHELRHGHLEFALLDAETLAGARAQMHGRLVFGRRRPDGLVLVIRRVLPDAMRRDVAAALA